MSELKHILLLDVDGVLLQPGGYRKAVTAAIDYFTRQAGLPDLAPEEAVLAFFESKGITNEWDIVPICLGAILEAVLGQFPGLRLAEDWELAAAAIQSVKVSLPAVDYHATILEVSHQLKPGKSPSAAIFDAGQDGDRAAPFPRLSRQPLFAGLFGRTKDITCSLPTRIFQNYVLGSEVYREIYGLEPQVSTPSFLDLYDRPHLAEDSRHELLARARTGRLHPVAYTARPSLPPAGVQAPAEGYSPEAELALKLVGLEEIPLMAYGRLAYAARHFQVSTDLLIKPSPFQALAAICAALMVDERWYEENIGIEQGRGPTRQDGGSKATHPTGNYEAKALMRAGEICKAVGALPDPAGQFSGAEELAPEAAGFIAGLRRLSLVVNIIEDSPIGIQAARHACQILNGLGLSVAARSWGVAQDAAKKAALEEAGAVVYPDVNAALAQVFTSSDRS